MRRPVRGLMRRGIRRMRCLPRPHAMFRESPGVFGTWRVNWRRFFSSTVPTARVWWSPGSSGWRTEAAVRAGALGTAGAPEEAGAAVRPEAGGRAGVLGTAGTAGAPEEAGAPVQPGGAVRAGAGGGRRRRGRGGSGAGCFTPMRLTVI